MPFFDKDKFQAEIVVDTSDSDGVVLSGDSIVGRVKIHVSESSSVRGVVLNYTVREHFATVPTAAAHNASATEKQSMLRGSRLRHKMQCLLLGSRASPPIDIRRGDYAYPFVISVPTELPPTCAPTILGVGHSCECCELCCNDCGQFANIVSVEHLLSLEIIIAYSLLDKDDIAKTVTVWRPVHPTTMLYAPSKFAVQASAPKQCGSCPCMPQALLRCDWMNADVAASFTLELTRPVLCLAEPQPIGFTVRGQIDCPFIVLLVRRTRVHWPGQRHPKVSKEVLAHYECPATYEHGGVVTGLLDTVRFSSASCPPSIRGSIVDVTYYVEIQPHFLSGHEGFCVDYLESMKVRVPVDVYNCTSQIAPMTSPSASHNAIAAMPSAAVFLRDGAPATEEGTANETTAFEMGVVFSYEPPIGYENAFEPAGPILEPLGPPVWGTVLTQ